MIDYNFYYIDVVTPPKFELKFFLSHYLIILILKMSLKIVSQNIFSKHPKIFQNMRFMFNNTVFQKRQRLHLLNLSIRKKKKKKVSKCI